MHALQFSFKRRPAIDSKCFDLAEHFLPFAPTADKETLASELQQAVDDFFFDKEKAIENKLRAIAEGV